MTLAVTPHDGTPIVVNRYEGGIEKAYRFQQPVICIGLREVH
jgi:hypothetical protein